MLRSSSSRSSAPHAFNNLVLALMSLITVNVTELGKAAPLYSKFFRSTDFNGASFHTFFAKHVYGALHEQHYDGAVYGAEVKMREHGCGYIEVSHLGDKVGEYLELDHPHHLQGEDVHAAVARAGTSAALGEQCTRLVSRAGEGGDDGDVRCVVHASGSCACACSTAAHTARPPLVISLCTAGKTF
jgi:hypothetical protein